MAILQQVLLRLGQNTQPFRSSIYIPTILVQKPFLENGFLHGGAAF
jgi:hypothetical protein